MRFNPRDSRSETIGQRQTGQPAARARAGGTPPRRAGQRGTAGGRHGDVAWRHDAAGLQAAWPSEGAQRQPRQRARPPPRTHDAVGRLRWSVQPRGAANPRERVATRGAGLLASVAQSAKARRRCRGTAGWAPRHRQTLAGQSACQGCAPGPISPAC
eukprot:366304-Chlamydomonas_euryale.AAC.5